MDEHDLANAVTLITGESVSGLAITRWEEVGFPMREGIEADRFRSEIIGPLMDILNAREGIVTNTVPVEAQPGSYMLNPGALAKIDEDVLEFLHEHAEELGLRVAVPNRYDVGLKLYEDLPLRTTRR